MADNGEREEEESKKKWISWERKECKIKYFVHVFLSFLLANNIKIEDTNFN